MAKIEIKNDQGGPREGGAKGSINSFKPGARARNLRQHASSRPRGKGNKEKRRGAERICRARIRRVPFRARGCCSAELVERAVPRFLTFEQVRDVHTGPHRHRPYRTSEGVLFSSSLPHDHGSSGQPLPQRPLNPPSCPTSHAHCMRPDEANHPALDLGLVSRQGHWQG